MIQPVNKLEELKKETGQTFVSYESELGMEWAPRYRRSDDYHKEFSYDWEYLRGLSSKPYHEITVTEAGESYSFRVKIDISSIIRNMVADLYYRNPEPFIQARRTPRDRNTNRMLSDVSKAVHELAGTEWAMKRALYNAFSSTGGSIIWTSFEQYGDFQQIEVLDEFEEPTGDVIEGDFIPTYQRPKSEFESLWRIRVDPDGREWDFSDHKYLIRLYHRSIRDCYDDERTYHDEGRAKLVHWAASDRGQRLSAEMKHMETDPAHINVTIAEIWDRTTKTVIHLPIGPDGSPANFDIGAKPWPSAFAKANNGAGRFPARLIATDWVTPDEKEREGWYPIPLARRLRGLIEDLTRLYTLFFQSAKGVVKKHIGIEGVMTKDDFGKLMATDADDIVLVKADNLRTVFGPNLENYRGASQLLEALPTKDGEAIKAIQFAAMIDKVWEQIYQLTGQGPGDRGGVAEAGSATEAANIRMQLDKRTADSVAEIGRAYDDITELLFLLLMEYQALPIPYQLTTDSFSQPVWDEFRAQSLVGMDLAYSHVTDSSRPKNKATERIERKEFLAVAAPFVTSKRKLAKLTVWALDPYDYPDPQDLIEDPAPDIAKEGLKLLLGLKSGEMQPTDINVAKKLIETLSQLCDAVLTDADMEEVAVGEAQADAQSIDPAGTGPRSATPGEAAAAGASAGRTNIM